MTTTLDDIIRECDALENDVTTIVLMDALKRRAIKAVAGERKALERVAELEGVNETLRAKAQNNIDRAYNRAITECGRPSDDHRDVRFPEYGTD